VREMVTNCRGNPLWLPILRAATGGRPYNFLFGSGLPGLGIDLKDAATATGVEA